MASGRPKGLTVDVYKRQAQTCIDTDAVAAAIDGEDALRQAPSISLKFASSSYCQTYFALILADGREWVVPFGSHPDRTGLENGRLYTCLLYTSGRTCREAHVMLCLA